MKLDFDLFSLSHLVHRTNVTNRNNFLSENPGLDIEERVESLPTLTSLVSVLEAHPLSYHAQLEAVTLMARYAHIGTVQTFKSCTSRPGV